MTPRTFSSIVKGHQTVHREKLYLHRESIIMNLIPHLEQAERKKSFAELMPLPWEPEYQKFIKKAPPADPKKAREEAMRKWEIADGKLKKEALSQSESPSE